MALMTARPQQTFRVTVRLGVSTSMDQRLPRSTSSPSFLGTVHVADRAPALVVPDELHADGASQLTELTEDEVEEVDYVDFEVGDKVVYPHHGTGQILKKEQKDVLGEVREYLTIKILHNDMTVMVPTENAAIAGIHRVIDEDTVKRVLAVLRDGGPDFLEKWNPHFKVHRDHIKTGDIYELAEVVRNLAIRAAEGGLSDVQQLTFVRAKKILASELMYALDMGEEEAEEHLDEVLAASIIRTF